jgi:hypothetical protein
LKNTGYEVVNVSIRTELLDDLPDEASWAVSFSTFVSRFERSDLQARLIDLGSTLPIVFSDRPR